MTTIGEGLRSGGRASTGYDAFGIHASIDALGVSLAFSGALGSGGVTLRLMQRSMCNMLTLVNALLRQIRDSGATGVAEGGVSAPR